MRASGSGVGSALEDGEPIDWPSAEKNGYPAPGTPPGAPDLSPALFEAYVSDRSSPLMNASDSSNVSLYALSRNSFRLGGNSFPRDHS
jgi:hypothetical protein